jgi:haloalkane dehalogenase
MSSVALIVGLVAGATACQSSRALSRAAEPPTSAPAPAANARAGNGVWVRRGPYRIHATDYPGIDPPIVLMHGFPDNAHLYDAVVPLLGRRHVVTFDFLGWGESDKPQTFDYTFAAQEVDLDAVITQLGLQHPALVAHDAGVPAAVNWALDHPQRVGSVTIMNGFYGPDPAARPPALAAFLAAGHIPPQFLGALPPLFLTNLAPLARMLTRSPGTFEQLLTWQETQFMSRPADASRYTPLFAAQFRGPDNSIEPLQRLTIDLVHAVVADAARLGELARAPFPVHLIWGSADPDLTVASARDLHRAAPKSDLVVIPGALHNVQIDQPGRVAALLLHASPSATATS